MLVVDGNFKAVHDRQKRPEDNVHLTEGYSFMTERDRFMKHLQVALETYDRGGVWLLLCSKLTAYRRR